MRLGEEGERVKGKRISLDITCSFGFTLPHLALMSSFGFTIFSLVSDAFTSSHWVPQNARVLRRGGCVGGAGSVILELFLGGGEYGGIFGAIVHELQYT